MWRLHGVRAILRASHLGFYGLSLSGEASGLHSTLIDCCYQS
jgi:hypothetical protein